MTEPEPRQGHGSTGEAGPAPDPDQTAPVCSAKGCRRPALWALRWNNPKIHTPERRKVWTACAEHRDHLSDFLSRRSLLREVVPVAESDAAAPGGPPDADRP